MITTGKKLMTKLEMARRIWIIRDILDKPLRQKDILKLWRKRGKIEYEESKQMITKGMLLSAPNGMKNVTFEEMMVVGRVEGAPSEVSLPDGVRYVTLDDIKIYKPKKLSDGIGISKSSLSKIINGYKENGKYYPGLVEEGILKKTFVEDEVGYSLVNNIKPLTKILIEFSNPLFSKSFITELRKDLINSEYAKKLINLDLVKKIGYEMNEEELNFTLTILKISPSALLEFLREIDKQKSFKKNPQGGKIPKGIFLSSEKAKRMRLMDLQFQAYTDISEFNPVEEKTTFNPPCPVEVKFEIKTTFKTENGEFKHVSKLQRSSFKLLSKLLSKEEQKEEIKKTWKLLEQLKSQLKSIPFPELTVEGSEKIDKRFTLESSPLSYEKKHS